MIAVLFRLICFCVFSGFYREAWLWRTTGSSRHVCKWYLLHSCKIKKSIPSICGVYNHKKKHLNASYSDISCIQMFLFAKLFGTQPMLNAHLWTWMSATLFFSHQGIRGSVGMNGPLGVTGERVRSQISTCLFIRRSMYLSMHANIDCNKWQKTNISLFIVRVNRVHEVFLGLLGSQDLQ